MAFFIEEQRDILDRYFKHHSTLSDSHDEMLRYLGESLDSFISKELAPLAAKNDAVEEFQVGAFKKLGALGFFALPYPEQFGGMNMNPVYYIAGLESLSKGDSGFTLGVAIHGTTCDGIFRFAGEHLKEKYLPDLIAGKTIGAFGLSEVEAGSDAKSMRTSYRFDNALGCYLLNGAKFWITNAPSAQIFFVMARNADRPEEISAFIVEQKHESSFKINPIKDKMGVRGSNTAELIFENHRVPKDHLIGKEGDGFKYAMHMLNGGRTTIGAWAVGIAQAAFEKFLKYAHERKLFGGHLKDLDNTKREVSEMLLAIKAGRELTYAAQYEKAIGHKNFPCNSALAKIKGTDAAFMVSERAIQLCGGFGYLRESLMERHLRDAILGRIGEGANEVLKIMVIPRFVYQAFETNPLKSNW